MVDNLETALYYIDWKSVVIALAVVALLIIAGTEAWKKIKEIFGIEFKKDREKREAYELLLATNALAKKTAENLDKLQNRHTNDEETFRNNLNTYIEESRKDRKALHAEMTQYSENRISDRQQSISIQKELKDSIKDLIDSQGDWDAKIENLTKMFVDTEIDDMRYKILDFASSLSSGKKFNRESFDHILKIYQKYEKILEEYGLENGLVEESIKYIKSSYNEYLTKGNVNY